MLTLDLYHMLISSHNTHKFKIDYSNGFNILVEIIFFIARKMDLASNMFIESHLEN